MLKIFSIPIQDVSRESLLRLISSAIKSKNQIQISTVNNEFLLESRKNHEFKSVLQKSFCIADSTGVVWAIKKIYKRKIEKIPGADFVYDLCREAEKNGWSIFLLGGDKNVAHVAGSKLIDLYPKLRIAGTIDGVKISPDQGNLLYVSKIKKSGASIVLVALGAPKQELWIASNMKQTKSNVFIGVGGTLDFVSGNIKRAPLFMRKLGLEWLFRLFTEPKRIKRILNAVFIFPLLVMKDKILNAP